MLTRTAALCAGLVSALLGASALGVRIFDRSERDAETATSECDRREFAERGPVLELVTPLANNRADEPLAGGWRVERDFRSCASLARLGTTIALRFALAPGRPSNQFAAAAAGAGSLAGSTGLIVTATADRPMRIAIQLRRRDDLGASRWRRTMYVDRTAKTVVLPFDEFVPVPPEAMAPPPLDDIAALLVGVDTMNTRPGTDGVLLIHAVRARR